VTDLPVRADFESAAQRLHGQIRRTPLLEVHGAELDLPCRVVLKLELTQHTGAFKARGALNALLTLGPGVTGVVAASGGNHGAAVAWAAGIVGIPADVFVPSTSPEEKVARIRGYVARTHVVDGYYPEALKASREWAADRPVAQVHAYNDRAVACGAGTLGLEIADQVPQAQKVIVPCGGGGLYAGTALALRDRAQVVPVEPSNCPNLKAALDAGTPVVVPVSGIAADSLGAEKTGDLAFAAALEFGTRPVMVSDEQIGDARRWLWQRCRVLAEPGGAAALAGLVSGDIPVRAGETVVVVVSGGNNPTIP
jgi:threonine dehydratase